MATKVSGGICEWKSRRDHWGASIPIGRWITSGEIQAVRIGINARIRRSEIEHFVGKAAARLAVLCFCEKQIDTERTSGYLLRVAQYLQQLSFENLVDMGCGSRVAHRTGTTHRDAHFVGIDQDEQVLEKARDKLRGMMMASRIALLVEELAKHLGAYGFGVEQVCTVGEATFATAPYKNKVSDFIRRLCKAGYQGW